MADSAERSSIINSDASRARGEVRDRALISAMSSGAVVRTIAALVTMGYFAISVRALSHAEFGVLATIATFTSLTAFADLGIGSGLMTRLAVAYGQDDYLGAKKFGQRCLGGHADPWSRHEPVRDSSGTGPSLGESAWYAVGRRWRCHGRYCQLCNLRWVRNTRKHRSAYPGRQAKGIVFKYLVAGVSCTTLAAVALAAVVEAPLWAFVAAVVGTPTIVAALQTLYVFMVAVPDLRPTWHLVTRGSMLSLSKVSVLFLVLNISVAFAYQTDMLVVASSLGAETAAVFAVGLRIYGVLSSVISGASQQLWTSMAEALSRGDMQWVKTRFLRVTLGTLGVATVISGAIVLLGDRIATVWVGPDLVPPRQLFVAFGVWSVYSLFMTQVGFLLNAAQIVGRQIVMALGMTAANISLSLYLVHRIGIIGPLIGSLVAHIVFTGIPAFFLIRQLFRRNLPAKRNAA